MSWGQKYPSPSDRNQSRSVSQGSRHAASQVSTARFSHCWTLTLVRMSQPGGCSGPGGCSVHLVLTDGSLIKPHFFILSTGLEDIIVSPVDPLLSYYSVSFLPSFLLSFLSSFLPSFLPFFLSFFQHLYWSIIALQWCVSFCFITK